MTGGSHVVVVGSSHQHLPLDRRARLRLDTPRAAVVAENLSAHGLEAVALSTCNRTELYVAGADARTAHRRAADAFEELGAVSGFAHADEDAARHLFRVAAGLDSLVTGESQILGQVRAAHGLALETGASGRTLNRLFRQAVEVGKRVRTETDLARHPVSIPSIAVELLRRELGNLTDLNVVVIGTGATAQLVALNLRHRGAGRIAIAGRTPARAAEVASRLRVDQVSFDDLADRIEDADAVVSATSALGYVVTPAHIARRARPLLLVDLAVPRDVDPTVALLPGCTVRDIDGLADIAEASLVRRFHEVPRAEGIAAEEAAAFDEWRRELTAAPAIASLRRRAEEIRITELARTAGRLAGLSPAQRRTVESLTAQIVGKLLHTPMIRAKEAAALEDGAYADVLSHLFALDES
jgi:glutamyl-tRNA reductase